MALIPYEPFRHLDNMRREMDRFFNQGHFFGNHDQELGMPRIDVHESENEVVATCDIPGLEKKDDVTIDIDGNNVLNISGTIHRSKEIKEEQMHRRERYTGRFHRSVTLPTHVSGEGVRATYRNGVLEIHMPKMKNENKKRIDVEFH